MTTADEELNQWLLNGEMARHNHNPGKTAVAIVRNGQAVKLPKQNRSDLEIYMQSVIDTALTQVHHTGQPEVEYRFHDTRQWRFDFAWPDYLLAVEVEGGQWVNGRHQRGQGFEDDCEKYNEAALDGWCVLRFTGGMVKDGRALATLLKALRLNEAQSSP
jgi:very-short-patch-repair endonuclease